MIASERRYRVLFDDNPSMYFMVDAVGTVLSVNRFGAERLGYEVQDLVGTSVLNVFHPEDQQAVLQNLSDCLSEVGQPEALGTSQSPKRWPRDLGERNRLGRAGTRTSPVVLIVCEDITAMKEAEIALHDSEELKNQILHSSADCIKVLDLEGRLQYMNDAGQTLLEINDLGTYTNKPWSEFWEETIGRLP